MPNNQFQQNLILYAETAFSRVVDSNHRCPQALRDTFADLREVVNARFPGRIDVQRLALSSFLIMRFFAAAILNPKLFGIKRENAVSLSHIIYRFRLVMYVR